MSFIVLALQLSLLSAPTGVGATSVACTFDHPQYAGQCVENVTPDENQTPMQACGVVLACLNNPQCVKTYCNATTLRGGWKLVAAKPASE